MLVKVLNMSGAPHADRFDGKDYVFLPGQTTVIPADAAVHIFGMGLKDRSRQIIRLGWAPTRADVPDALERLDAFLFEQVASDDDEPLAPEPTAMERPTRPPDIDPALSPVKTRTRNVLAKAQ